MLNAQLARARIADRNCRAERIAAQRQLLTSNNHRRVPNKAGRQSRRRVWSRSEGTAPIQA